jgi:hypothetical protein
MRTWRVRTLTNDQDRKQHKKVKIMLIENLIQWFLNQGTLIDEKLQTFDYKESRTRNYKDEHHKDI